MSTVGGPDWPETLALIWSGSAEPGAVGSTEAPPNPWTGISGPAGPLQSIAILQTRIAVLEAERAELEEFGRKRVLLHQSACDDYEDILATKAARIAALEADNVTLTEELGTAHRAIAWLEHKLAALTAFTDDPPDLPDPPRRPDGTLMPQPKALTVPRETGDKRRVGS